MLLNDDEIKESMESPLNLLNRLKGQLNKVTNNQNSNVYGINVPKAEDIVPNLDDKLKDTTTRSKAVGILNAAMDELKVRLQEVQKPERLAAIAAEMSKVVAHQDNKNVGEKLTSQIIVYAPQVHSIDSYEIVEVTE